MSAPATQMPRTGFKFMLTVREGPDLGHSYQLLPPRVTIGRGADCHVALTDPRVSRSAAVIDFAMERITISDVSGRQTLFVNGENVIDAAIKDGDLIQLGDTQMTFFVEAMALVQRPESGFQHLPGQGPRGQGASTPSFSNGGLSGRQKFYIGIVVLGLAFTYLMTEESAKKRKDGTIRTVEQIEKEIKESDQRREDFIKKRVFKNDDEKVRYEEAHRHFQEGFRDYQKGNAIRALRSFETAKTIDPQHPLADRYYRLAGKLRDEQIADLTLEGRRYREKAMYTRCSAQFEKVLDMIPNKEDAKYKVAEALKKECDLHWDNRFRY